MAALVSRIAEKSIESIHRFWNAGIEFVYPSICPLCRAETNAISRSAGLGPELCQVCKDLITSNVDNACFRCGARVGPYLDASVDCPQCRNNRFAFDCVIRMGVYENRLRDACIQAKNRGAESLTAALANLLWEQKSEALQQAQIDLVLPIPQHWTHRIRKPHNPPATLARVLAHRLQVDFSTHILSKIRNTPDQSSLSSQHRRENLRRAFRVRGASVLAGLSVLLLDDILTTGTTANEASKALRKASAQHVTVAVVAVVPKEILKTSGT